MLFCFMQVFYAQNITDKNILIDSQEHIHLAKVLRKTVGDEIYVCNGKGLLVLAEIISSSKKETVLQVKRVVANENNNKHHLVIGIAPTKNMDRLEWMVEKCVEIGVNGIAPFYSQNSERRRLKLERLEGKALSAMKQSKALFLPSIQEAVTLEKLIKQSEAKHKYIAYVEEETNDIQAIFPQIDRNETMLVLIGPEGGFTKEEVDLAVENGFKSISLGQQRLRTETAGVFVASAYQLLCK